MISYKPTKWKELLGDFKAKIEAVSIERNRYFDPAEDNSTENVLTFDFMLEDPVTLESIPFTQKFIAPLTGGNGLFQQLLDLKEILPDADGGNVDEQMFVGMELIVTLEKNKKGYSFVKSVKLQSSKTVKPVTKKPETKLTEEEEKLPFD